MGPRPRTAKARHVGNASACTCAQPTHVPSSEVHRTGAGKPANPGGAITSTRTEPCSSNAMPQRTLASRYSAARNWIESPSSSANLVHQPPERSPLYTAGVLRFISSCPDLAAYPLLSVSPHATFNLDLWLAPPLPLTCTHLWRKSELALSLCPAFLACCTSEASPRPFLLDD